MNGYELTRDWFDFRFENPDKCKPIHTELYIYIIDQWNRLGQVNKFGLPTQYTMQVLNINSYNTFKTALDKLVEFGFIHLVSESKNQHQSRVVALSKNDKASSKALDKANANTLYKAIYKAPDTIIEQKNNTEQQTKEDMSSKPDVGVLVDKYLVWFNKIFDRKFRSDTYTKLCTSKFKVLLKKYGNNVDAFSQDLLKVGNTVKLDSYHIETNYKHVTPEFILRPDKFEKFLNVQFLEDKNRIEKWKTPADIFLCMDWIKRIPKPPDYETQTAAYEMFMYEWRISELMTYQYDRAGAHSNLSEYED